MRRAFIAMLLTMLFSLTMLSGCGGVNMPAAGTTQAEAGNEAKDSLVIGIGAEFSQVVPNSNNVAVANRDGAAIYALYDTLLWRNTETGEIEPWLATSWDVSDDGLEYTIKLREDVTFHNGAPMTAADVAWTYNLLPDNPNVMSQQFPPFDHAEAVDEYTVKIYLSSPFVPFVNGMASYHMGILSKSYFDEVGGWEGYIAKPIGTGPYKFVSRTIGSNLKLEAYDGYWADKAKITNVTFNILPDANSQIMSLENGEVDALLNVNVQNLLHLNEKTGAKWESCISDSCTQLGFNAGMSRIIEDDNLRKAIASAINYDGLIQNVMGGYVEKAQTFTHDGAGITGRASDGTFTGTMEYDVEAAKKYLADSNYIPGTELSLICVSGSPEESIAKVIQGDLQSIGINVQVNPIDGASYFAKSYEPTGYDLSLNTYLPSLFDAYNLSQGQNRSARTYQTSLNPNKEKLADLADAANVEMDPKARQAIYAEMQSLINENVYNNYMFYSANTVAYREGLEGAKPIAGSNLRISQWYWK
ncbi:ABC transporter substrate-binding protein [Enterocloster asparagiformis]|uniref:ABC transporter substrate-binding protein n=1 Tax=Enterocloster asparagiformis TaxID=333367 RepID=UPI0009DE3D01|nr:ABC transporter substrate-binding protein [Enterocloster asparagiformis]